MNHLGDLVLPAALALRIGASSREQVLQILAKLLADAGDVDSRAVCESVVLRERLAGTGIGEGVAIPHAMMEGLSRPIGGFARLDPPADFAAMDGRPADLVFMLLAPKERAGDHLKALARISRFFRRAHVRDTLRAARTREELYAVFSTDSATRAA